MFDRDKKYKFSVKLSNIDKIMIYTGFIIEEDSVFIKVKDKYLDSVIIKKDAIIKADEVNENGWPNGRAIQRISKVLS